MNQKKLKNGLSTAFHNFRNAIDKHQDINSKRADGGWSVGEIGNHIVKSTGTEYGASGKTERPYDQHAQAIKEMFLNFNMKFHAMPFLIPDAKEYTKSELFDALDANLKAVYQMIETENLTETCTDIELPVWGCLTKYEWLVLMENHIIRHTKQVTNFNS
jgi:hypothetical protein